MFIDQIKFWDIFQNIISRHLEVIMCSGDNQWSTIRIGRVVRRAVGRVVRRTVGRNHWSSSITRNNRGRICKWGSGSDYRGSSNKSWFRFGFGSGESKGQDGCEDELKSVTKVIRGVFYKLYRKHILCCQRTKLMDWCVVIWRKIS